MHSVFYINRTWRFVATITTSATVEMRKRSFCYKSIDPISAKIYVFGEKKHKLRPTVSLAFKTNCELSL